MEVVTKEWRHKSGTSLGWGHSGGGWGGISYAERDMSKGVEVDISPWGRRATRHHCVQEDRSESLDCSETAAADTPRQSPGWLSLYFPLALCWATSGFIHCSCPLSEGEMLQTPKTVPGPWSSLPLWQKTWQVDGYGVGLKPIKEGSIPSFPDYFRLMLSRSSNVWYGGGHPLNHSKFVVVSSTARTSRLDANASQIMKIINMTAVREMNEPMDEIVFHAV